MTMKFRFKILTILTGWLVPFGVAYSNPSDSIQLSAAAGGSWDASWSGVDGRTYFFQWSLDLETWAYTAFLDFSEGAHQRSFTSSSPSFFIRHHYTDEPTTDPWLEDFADDGISSYSKLLMGLSPFAPLAWLDVDGDGIHDSLEQFWFGNLTSTQGDEDDANGNGIRDEFEIQAGQDPKTDATGDMSKRTNYQYDMMGRLTVADDVTFEADNEGNLETVD